MLSLVFSILLIPKEYIHDLYGHEDTPCGKHNESAPHVEKKHTHCQILKFEASIFYKKDIAIKFSEKYNGKEISLKTEECKNFYLFNISQFRAPPFITS